MDEYTLFFISFSYLPMAEDVDVEAADAAAVPLLLFDCCCEVDDSANVSVVFDDFLVVLVAGVDFLLLLRL